MESHELSELLEYFDREFEFENGAIAKIKSDGDVFMVSILDSDNSFEVSGFPSEMNAFRFVMLGDLRFESENDFIKTTNPSYTLKWQRPNPLFQDNENVKKKG